MKRLLKIIGNNQVLVRNFTSLSLLQLANYIFPIITLPYLVRVLGPEKYGLINFATAFTAYFNIITDYGFNLSATQEVSVNRNNKEKVSEIFSSVLIIKILLFLLSTVILFLVVIIFPLFRSDYDLYAITFIGVLGTVLFPLWFYQGIEQMKYILIINVVVRAISIVIIFLIVKVENDYLLLAIIYTVTQLLIGIIGLIFAIRKYELKYLLSSKNQLIDQLKKGWDLFLSSIWINLYTTSNVFILGLFAPNNVVGYFAAANKIRIAFQGILSSMSQSVFPYVNKLLSESYQKFISFNKKLLKISVTVGVIISVFLFLFAEPIVNIVLGSEYSASIIVLRIIAWLPLIIFLSNVFGIQTMLPLNYHKNFAKILFFAAVINLIISFLIVPMFLAIGTSISVLITEIFVTVSFFIFIKRKNIQIV
ncbi:MAG: transporter [Ignavibacteriales bacterium UTCHB2]|nr:MAG: putative O-antigen transporter [Ignavibacteria bacterium ADurb.Bin266]OQY70733.1 MAG: transporter [Ignavibacteriales bacterium UTCHB2]HQI41244.1 flippase [Ignavibacteriaceae bacterium]